MRCSTPGRRTNRRRSRSERDRTFGDRFQTKEIRGAVGCHRRQHRAVHRGAQRQRPALPRLRHPRSRRDLRVRGDRLSVDPRKAAERRRARRLQGEAQESAWYSGAGARNTRTIAAGHASDGCACVPAHRRWGACCPRRTTTMPPGAREIADHLLACFPSMLCYWYHFSHSSRRIHVETDDDSVGGHFLHLLHRRAPSASWVRAMHTSLILYAEHEFNSSTFTARVIAGTGSDIYFVHHRRHRRAARSETRRRQRSRSGDPGALRHARRGRGGYPAARGEQGDRDRLRTPRLHRERSAQRGHQASGREARPRGGRPDAVWRRRTH